MKYTKAQIINYSQAFGNYPVDRDICIHSTKEFTITAHITKEDLFPDPIVHGPFPRFTLLYKGNPIEVIVEANTKNISGRYINSEFMGCGKKAPTRDSFSIIFSGMDRAFGPKAVCNSIADFIGYFYYPSEYKAISNM